jgi:hypothetical protein
MPFAIPAPLFSVPVEMSPMMHEGIHRTTPATKPSAPPASAFFFAFRDVHTTFPWPGPCVPNY